MGIEICMKKNREIYVQLINFSMILERAEYEPMAEDTAPTMMTKTHSVICNIVHESQNIRNNVVVIN